MPYEQEDDARQALRPTRLIEELPGCAAPWWKVFRGDVRDHMPPSDSFERVDNDQQESAFGGTVRCSSQNFAPLL